VHNIDAEMGHYVISERPMTEENWIKAHASNAEQLELKAKAIEHEGNERKSNADPGARRSRASLEPCTGHFLCYYANSRVIGHGVRPMKSMQLTLVEQSEMRPVKQGRKPNEAYRVREHLTEDGVDRLLAALRANRHGHRDWLIGLLIYRHGLRVSEACDLRWDDINLAKRTIIVRRLKGSDDSTHYLECS
jgi:integrase